MSHTNKEARTRAEAAFEKVQAEARERERVGSQRGAQAREADDKIARLRALRLERDAAERKS